MVVEAEMPALMAAFHESAREDEFFYGQERKPEQPKGKDWLSLFSQQAVQFGLHIRGNRGEVQDTAILRLR